jgi:hypothetical protein
MVKSGFLRTGLFLALIPLAFIIVSLFYFYGNYSWLSLFFILVLNIVIAGFFCFSEFSIWGKIGLALGLLLLFFPIYLCTTSISEQANPEKFAQKLKPVSLEGKLEFLNPALTLLKSEAGKVGGFFGEISSRLIGFKTLTGELQCTYFPRYLLIGFFAALWIFLGFASFLYRFVDKNIISIFKIWLGSPYPLILGANNSLSRFMSMPSRTLQDKWLPKIADKWWKFLIMVLSYTYIMSFIPGLNQIIKILTLEIFQPNWFIQSIIIATELGFAPAIYMVFYEKKKRMKFYKKELAKGMYKKIAEDALD